MSENPTFYARYGKRAFDLTIVVPAIFLLLPLMAVIGFMVLFGMGPPIVFAQKRPGLHGQPFLIRKFRTMTDFRDFDGNLLPDEHRLTRLGRLLRSTSLDELPELWNVLCGEMSLVGPRPLRMEYMSLYTPYQARRHECYPGITGWAQVNGRNAISWEQRFELDVWYVENVSLRLDIEILFRTVWAVIRRDGISAHGEATMYRFTGSPTFPRFDPPSSE